MRQRLNPWAVVLAAALTFGGLMAFVGPRSAGYHYWGHRGYYGPPYGVHHDGCDGHYRHKHHDQSTEKADTSTSSLR
ncbi:hypothetical protein [Spirosoma aerolatum]|uniref:hypothetical protein n=1 Tax=Spirosoma aerolatum TaxID=1211326 RepID=UPI0009ADFBE2|nr:hypothetical protein [Spirosoma aerolatum]